MAQATRDRKVSFQVVTGNLQPTKVTVEIQIAEGHTLEAKCSRSKIMESVWYANNVPVPTKAKAYRYRIDIIERSFFNAFQQKTISYNETDCRFLSPLISNFRDVFQPPGTHNKLLASDVYPGLEYLLQCLSDSSCGRMNQKFRELEQMWSAVELHLLHLSESEYVESLKLILWLQRTIMTNLQIPKKVLFLCVMFGKLAPFVNSKLRNTSSSSVTESNAVRVLDILKPLDTMVLTDWCYCPLRNVVTYLYETAGKAHWLYLATDFSELFQLEHLKEARLEYDFPSIDEIENNILPKVMANYKTADAVVMLQMIPQGATPRDKPKILEVVGAFVESATQSETGELNLALTDRNKEQPVSSQQCETNAEQSLSSSTVTNQTEQKLTSTVQKQEPTDHVSHTCSASPRNRETAVSFRVLVRNRNVTHVKLCIIHSSGNLISKYDMRVNKVGADDTWVCAEITVPISMNNEWKYQYTVTQRTKKWFTDYIVTNIAEHLERTTTLTSNMYDIYHCPNNESFQMETTRKGKLMYLDGILASVSSENLAECMKQVVELDISGKEDRVIIKDTCEWMQNKTFFKPMGSLSSVSEIQFKFVALILTRLIQSAKAVDHKWFRDNFLDYIIRALPTFATGKFPIRYSDIECLCIFVTKAKKGNLLYVWENFFHVLGAENIDQLRKHKAVEPPELTWETWNVNEASVKRIVDNIGSNDESAVETLIVGLVSHADDTRVLNVILKLHKEISVVESYVVNLTACRRANQIIEYDLRHLAESWFLFIETNKYVAESVRPHIIQFLQSGNWDADNDTLRSVLLDKAIYNSGEEFKGAMKNMLQQLTKDSVQQIFIKVLQSSDLMMFLNATETFELITGAIKSISPSVNHHKKEEAIQGVYSLVAIFCQCNHFKKDLQNDVKWFAYENTEGVPLNTLLQAVSPEKTKYIASEALKCLAEYIQYRLQEDKSIRACAHHLSYFRGCSQNHLSVTSTHICDILVALIETQERPTCTTECEKSAINLGLAVEKILQNSEFWLIVFQSTGYFSGKLKQHPFSRAVTELLEKVINLVSTRKITRNLLKIVKQKETASLFELVARTLPVYQQSNIKQWKTEVQHMIDTEKAFENNVLHLRDFFHGCMSCLPNVVYVQDYETLTSELRKRIKDFESNESLILYDTSHPDYWGPLFQLIPVAEKLHQLVPSKVFCNICRSVIGNTFPEIREESKELEQPENRHTTANPAEHAPTEENVTLESVLKGKPIATVALAQLLSHLCVPEFKRITNMIFTNSRVPVRAIEIMMTGIENEDFSEEIKKLERCCDTPLTCEMKSALGEFGRLPLFQKRAEYLATIFEIFDVSAEDDVQHNALKRFHGLCQQTMTLKELLAALEKVAVIEHRFDEDEWIIVEELTQSRELVTFLRTVIAEDLRNLINAVEERSEQSVDESKVSDLIDVKRYLEPLLKVQTADELLEAIRKNRHLALSVKDIPSKLHVCIYNVYSLMDLYNNVANRGEMTKEIIGNALENGVYSFKHDGICEVCHVELSYKRGNSESKYSLDELNDLKSRALLLVNSQNSKSRHYSTQENSNLLSSTPNLTEFIDCITSVNDVVDLCTWLADSGHFDYRQYERNVKGLAELQEIRKGLKRTYDHWQRILSESRQNYFFLNFFHSKHLWQLDHFFTGKSAMTEDLRLLFHYVHPGVEVDTSIRYVYEMPARMDDLRTRLFHIGDALQQIFHKYPPMSRDIPGNIEVSKSTLNSTVQSGCLFVAQLDVRSLKSVPVLLRLYKNTTGLIPEPGQVLFCRSDTSWEEVYLLIQRCIGACKEQFNNRLHTLVNVELLPLDTQFLLVKEIKEIQESDHREYLLAIICRGGNYHHIIDQFSDCTHRVHNLSDAEMRSCLRTGWPDVEVVTSSQPGLGKTEYVRNKANERGYGVSTMTVSGPVTKTDLVKQVQRQKLQSYQIFHIDVAPMSDPGLFDSFLFETIITGMAVSGTHMCKLPTSGIIIELSNTQDNMLRNALSTSCSFNSKHLEWTGFQDYVISIDINSPVQVVCHYLKSLSQNTLDSTDIILAGQNKNVTPLKASTCRRLLEKEFETTEILSFTIVETFLSIFAQELRRMSASLFFNTKNLKDMVDTNNVRSQLVKALLDVSKEFSSRSVQCVFTDEKGKNETETILQITRTSGIITATQMVNRLQGMVKWADSNHLLVVFHRHDSQTISPLYRLENQVSSHIRQLFETQMKRGLKDYNKVTQKELHSILEKIVRNTRKPFNTENLKELKSNYALTPDNLLKMVLIHMRIKSNIPVIVMGETGCGKTTLITYLARVCEVHFDTLNLHAGVTEETILEFIESLQDSAEKNLKQEVWGFFDEINTCDHLGLLNEVICRHSCKGNRLPHNLVFIAACNPYKLRKGSSLSAGLEGKVQRDEQSKLVYRVHPLPESMMDYVWDFGSLDKKDEDAYIRRMLESNDEALVDLVVMSQDFMRKTHDTSYCVSLRDVSRCQYLSQWFEQVFQTKKVADVPGDNPLYRNTKIRSMILALAHCYHSRLTKEIDRDKYRDNVATILTEQKKWDVNKTDIERMIRAEQMDLLKRMQLPAGTAKNEALRENVFVVLVSILNRIPVFVVGKPGCSKSLSIQLIRSNLRGPDSRDDFFKKQPVVYVIPHQGSESSTSEGITKVFDKAKKYKKANPDVMPVVLLDEIGLAEVSSFNPLKVLHSQLEPTVGGFPPVAVVGISNWALDAAKMNRAIHLSRPEPTVNDLEYTALSIRDDCVKSNTGGSMYNQIVGGDRLKHLAEAYSNYQLHQTHKDFHGLRDYYCLVEYVAFRALDNTNGQPSEIFQTGLLRNFGGLQLETNKIIKSFLGQLKIAHCPETSPAVVDLIRSNLDDEDARHLMLIANGDSALNILEQTLSGKDYVTIFGSRFEHDVSEEYYYGILSKIIVCMERGVVLILRDLENIYGSLYDMLNQNYTIIGKKMNCRVALGPYSNPMCQVHKRFRCIVLVDEQNVDYQNPPFLNRFEKQTLRFSDILSSRQQEVVNYLRQWIDDISLVDDVKFLPEGMFLGLHDETLPSLVYLRSSGTESKIEINSSELVKQCKADLMRVACPDAVLRASKSKWAEEHHLEVREFQQAYFSLPQFTGLKHFLTSKLEVSDDQPEKEVHTRPSLEHNCHRMVIYTHSSIHTDVAKCVGTLPNVCIEKLSNFKSERHLNTHLQHFWLESDQRLLIMQCMTSVDAEHMLLAKCTIDHYRNEYLKSVDSEGRCKHACIIVHIDRKDKGKADTTCSWQFNFLCGWQQFTLDTLEQSSPTLLDLLEETVHDHFALHTIKLDPIINELLLWCFSCIKYDAHFRNADDVMKLAGTIAHSEYFKASLQKHILKFIQAREKSNIETSIVTHNTWQTAVACDKDLLFRCSTLVRAMVEYIKQCVKEPLGKIIIFLEQHNAWVGSPISTNSKETTSEFWQACFDNPAVFDMESNALPQQLEIESYSVECRYLELRFPFFNVFHNRIEGNRVWLMENDDKIDENDVENEQKVIHLSDQLTDIIKNTHELQCRQYIAHHVDDFCNDLLNAFSVEYAPTLASNIRLKIMKWLLAQFSSRSELKKSPVEVIANTYATLWTYKNVLAAELQLISIYNAISSEDTEQLFLNVMPKIGPSIIDGDEKQAAVRPERKPFEPTMHYDDQNEDNVLIEQSESETVFLTGGKANEDPKDATLLTSTEYKETTQTLLVSEICKLLLPSKETVHRCGGIDRWQQKASLVLILAGRVSSDSVMLHFLRLCRDFVTLVSGNYNLSTQQVVALNQISQGVDDPLATKEVFDFVINIVQNCILEADDNQRIAKLEEFLCMYFGLCLEADLDTRLLPCIIQTLCKESGEPLSGSRPVLLDILKNDIEGEVKEANTLHVCEQLILTGEHDRNSFPNLVLINELLLENDKDSHLAAVCCDIVEDVAFKYITCAEIGTVVSGDDQILMIATEAVGYITETQVCSLRLVVAAAYVRAFLNATAQLFQGKSSKAFTINGKNFVFAKGLNGLLHTTNDQESPTKLCLLNRLREHKPLYKLQQWCGEMVDPLTALYGLKWQTVLFSSRLGYSPLAYVARYSEAIDAVKAMKNQKDRGKLTSFLSLAKTNPEYRIALLAAIADLFYFVQTTVGPKASNNEDAQWLYKETGGFTYEFREFCRRLLGLIDFNGILQLGESTSQGDVEIASVVVHLLSILLSYADKNTHPMLLMLITQPTATSDEYLPGLGQTCSIFRNQQEDCLMTNCPCGTVSVKQRWSDESRCPVCDRQCKDESIPLIYKSESAINEKGFKRSYIDEGQSATETVRGLSLPTYRVLRVLIHSCYLAGHSMGFLTNQLLVTLLSNSNGNDALSSNGTTELEKSQIADKNTKVTPTDGKEELPDSDSGERRIIKILQDNWRLLRDITFSSHENVTLLLHSILRASTKKLVTNQFETIENRNQWEKSISEIIDKKVTNLPQERSVYKSTCLSAQGIPTSCLEVQIEELDSTNISTLRRLLRSRRSQSFADFQARFCMQSSEQGISRFPFLQLYISRHDHIQYIRYLPVLLKWNKHVASTLSHGIKRKDANQAISFFLRNELFHPDEDAKSLASDLFYDFQKAWNSICHGWVTLTGQKPEFDVITDESAIYLCVVDPNEKQNHLRTMMKTLQAIQNNFVMDTLAIASKESCPSLNFLVSGNQMAGLKGVPLNNARDAIIDYKWSDDLLDYCDINTEYGCGSYIRYNFSIIERTLALRLVLNKAILTDGQTFTQFRYSDDLSHACSAILSEIDCLIQQEKLSKDSMSTILSEHNRRQTFAKDLLEHLEVILVLLKKTGANPKSSLDDYIKRWSKHLPGSFPDDLLPEPKDSIQMCHVVDLYEILEDQLVGATLASLNDGFRKPIPDLEKCRLEAKLKTCIIENLEELSSLIRRFIFRYLRSGLDRAVLHSSLTTLMERSVGNTMDCSKATEVIPEELTVAHVVKILDVINEQIELQRDAARKKTLNNNRTRPRTERSGRRRRGGILEVS